MPCFYCADNKSTTAEDYGHKKRTGTYNYNTIAYAIKYSMLSETAKAIRR